MYGISAAQFFCLARLEEKRRSVLQRIEKAPEPTLVFIIDEAEDTSCNLKGDNQWLPCRKFSLIREQDGAILNLRKPEEISKIYRKIKIILNKENGKKLTLSPMLSIDFHLALLKIILHGRPSKDYYCTDFFMDTYGLYSNQSVNYIHGHWKALEYQEDLLKPLDAIIIKDKKAH